jgi:hypothetical protein
MKAGLRTAGVLPLDEREQGIRTDMFSGQPGI